MKSKAKKSPKTTKALKKKPRLAVLSRIKRRPKQEIKKLQRKNSGSGIPTLRASFRRSFAIIRKNWKPLGLATSVYAVLYFLFVRVLTNVDINELSDTVTLVFGDGEESFFTQVLTVGTLFGESTNFDNQTGIMYALVTLVSSLAFIWLLRHVWSDRRLDVKQAFYQGMYPLIPYTLVLLFIVIQLLPFTLAGIVFQIAFNNSLAIGLIERMFFIGVFAGGAVISAYFILGSLMASYAVTIPGVAPSQARKTAKRMLTGRRFLVLKQLLIFLVITGVAALAPMLLVVWVVPQIAIVSAALVIVALVPWLHLYLYGMYRDLLDD